MSVISAVNTPDAEREASESPLEGGEDNYLDYLNPKHETNSNDKNSNAQNMKPLYDWPLQKKLIRCYRQAFRSDFHCFKHLNIRVLNLFRISIFEFRIFYSIAILSLVGNTFPDPPCKSRLNIAVSRRI